MPKPRVAKFGRGTDANPSGRFEGRSRGPDAVWDIFPDEPEGPGPATTLLPDAAKTIIATNDSPDVPFEASLNPYRGCEHGCVYCYARPTHEYMGFSAGLDFESKIVVKYEAPRLLREALSSPRWKPKVLAMSGVTDCYQPAERRLKITRGCLEVLADFRNPVGVITKNVLVSRDADVLGELARFGAAEVMLSMTTMDEDLARILEPRASRPRHRLAAIEQLAKAGIPVGVMVAPVIPAVTDHEMPRILKAATDAGARFAGYTLMRLPYGVKDLFSSWLDRHFPDRKKKVLHRLEELRGGRINDPRFGSRMRGDGIFARQIKTLFEQGRRKAGLTGPQPPLSTAHFRRPGGEKQLPLFGENA
jgi:DNA repair photolyase